MSAECGFVYRPWCGLDDFKKILNTIPGKIDPSTESRMISHFEEHLRNINWNFAQC